MGLYPHLAYELTHDPAALPVPVEMLPAFTASEIMALPPVAFLDADHIIQDGGSTIVVGQPGAGKSLWMLRKLLEISASHPVYVIAAEAQSGLADRLKALQIATGARIPDAFQFCLQPVNLRDSRSKSDLKGYQLRTPETAGVEQADPIPCSRQTEP